MPLSRPFHHFIKVTVAVMWYEQWILWSWVHFHNVMSLLYTMLCGILQQWFEPSVIPRWVVLAEVLWVGKENSYLDYMTLPVKMNGDLPVWKGPSMVILLPSGWLNSSRNSTILLSNSCSLLLCQPEETVSSPTPWFLYTCLLCQDWGG